VLKHAFLNSYFQTGLKNLMDVAIIRHAGEDELKPLCENYKKVDEIPFDFNRRRMSVVVEDRMGKTQLITKGAIEEMLGVLRLRGIRGQGRAGDGGAAGDRILKKAKGIQPHAASVSWASRIKSPLRRQGCLLSGRREATWC
jgi:magnesium-transporting ATPase (P-type)